MEFDLIERYFKPLSLTTRPGDLAIGDDGALFTLPADHQLVVVTDTLVSGVHFLAYADPYDIGWKALAVNLSDLAAMGAEPGFYSLALTLPEDNSTWLALFAQGLKDCAQASQIPLIGGDTTRGPLTVTVCAQGWVPRGQALLRKGAQVGDDIYVSGYIGDAGAGLQLAKDRVFPLTVEQQVLVDKLNRPQPRIELGRALRGMANSAVDISDGLLADLQHVLQASEVGAELVLNDIPLRDLVKVWADKDRFKPLRAGDDYELCFTASPEQRVKIEQVASRLNLGLYRIGKVVQSPGLVIDGVPQTQGLGYQHF
jgi:thiamine-monophosphate kinase